jgi:uncharacterized protein (TIGR02594 family)
MRLLIAALFLLFVSPVHAVEPPIEGRFGFGPHWADVQKPKKTPQRVASKKAPKVAAKPKAAQRPPVSQAEAVQPSNLVATARQYLGTNPTGWARLWCGRFMAMVAPQAARLIGNANLAVNWAKLPRTSPRVGAIAVLTRRGGGHVGVVSGFDRKGNPIIISGNHNRRVAEAVYPKHRVIAYVAA